MKRFSVIGAVCAIIFSAVLGYFFLKYDLKETSEEKQFVQSDQEIDEAKNIAPKSSKPDIENEKQEDFTEESILTKQSNILKNNIIPEFDVVRVEKSGEALFAGRALAGSKIVIELNGKEIAQTKADDTGSFVALPVAPLTGESNQVTIRSISPDGAEVISKQVVAIGVTGDSEPLVALAEPGKAINVLQKPEVKIAQTDAEEGVSSVQGEVGNNVTTDVAREDPKSLSAVEDAESLNEVAAGAPEEGEKVASLVDRDDTNPDDSVEQDIDNSSNGSLENIGLNVNKQEVAGNFKDNELSEKKRVARLVIEQNLDTEQKNTEKQEQDAHSSDLQSEGTLSDVSNDQSNGTNTSTDAEETAKTSENALTTKNVSVEAIEVDKEKLFIAGEGAEGQSVRIYIDEKPVGDIEVKENGRWLLEKTEELKPGEYKIRVDQLSKKDASVIARAEVPFVVEEKTQAEIDLAGGSSIIIRRDDNLWTIAQRVYGSGIRYTAIYEQNRDQIRDPDLIFPGQIFNLPKLQKEPTSRSGE